jgi:uncharacterized protein DUF5990
MRIEIRGHELPGGACAGHAAVAVGVQHGREVVDLQPADADEVVWAFDLTEARDRDGGTDVRGPFVHGRPGARFVYLSWRGVGADGPQMFRRAKLMLDPALLARGVSGTLVADVRLTMADGTPLCAAVRPPVVTWSVRPD